MYHPKPFLTLKIDFKSNFKFHMIHLLVFNLNVPSSDQGCVHSRTSQWGEIPKVYQVLGKCRSAPYFRARSLVACCAFFHAP